MAGVASDDQVFKALGDPTRRFLLDALYRRDGQTLTELEAGLDMTRFGVMKHLRVLEEAGLVATRRSGREKLHFLNPVPIRLIHDRWIDKYTEPWVAALSDLKQRLESTMEKSFRDLHPHHAGTSVGGHHRPGDPEQVQLRCPDRVGLDPGVGPRDERSERRAVARRG